MIDVTIRGAGIFGLSIAWNCVCRGARVQVIDPFGVGAGSSGGLVGALSPHVPEAWNPKKEFQLESLLLAESWWARVEAAAGRPSSYGRVGRLQPLADSAAVAAAQRRTLTAATHWRGAAEWRVEPATNHGWEPVSPSGWIVRDTLSARVSPRVALQCLVQALTLCGVPIVKDAENKGVVVHATGVAGLQDLSEALGRKAGSGVKGQALALAYDARTLPQLFVDGLHIVPHFDGTVAIGSTSEPLWVDPGPDQALDALLAKAVAAIPALAGARVVDRWAGVRPRSTSRAPLLGAWPGRTGEFVANGGFKIGFGMAPKIAEVMADLVLNGHDAIPEDFRVQALP